MKRSKLLETLDLFSRDELVSLDNFLRSPYFHSDKMPKELHSFFQYIMSYEANLDHPNLEKENVFKYLYPKEKFIKGKIDKLMSALLKQIHEFIVIHFDKKSKSSIQKNINLISFFRERNSNKFANHYFEKTSKSYEKEILQGKDYFFDGYLINQESVQIHLVQSKDFKSLDLVKAHRPLDIYYMLSKLEYACFLLSIDRFRQPIEIGPIIKFIDDLKPICIDHGFLKNPLLNIYFHTYELLKRIDETDTSYKELKDLINKNEKLIPFESKKALSGLIRNLMLRRLNLGDKNLVEEIFILYKSHLEKGYLEHEKGILPSTFKNIVSMGLRSKNYDYVFNFLEKYKTKIKGTQFPEDVYYFNLAYFYFEQKKYDQALELLVDQYDDLFYKISAKRMELKIYYETKSSILPSKIDAFKIYIFRLSKRVIRDHLRSNNNHYVNFLRQLNNPQTALDPKRKERLKKKIKENKLVVEKAWLLEKLDELK